MKRLKKLLLSMGLVVAVLVAMLVPATVFAESDNVSVSVNVTAGSPSLDISAATSLGFTATAITGSAITSATTQPGDWWILTDNSGDGEGWDLQIKAASATFTNSDNRSYTDDLTLDSSLACDKWTLTALVSRTDSATLAVSDNTSEPVSGLYGTSSGGGDVDGSATNVATSDIYLLRAPAEAGMGSYTVKPKFVLQLPASVYYGVYSVTLTLTTTFN